jgi:hypothetical protein
LRLILSLQNKEYGRKTEVLLVGGAIGELANSNGWNLINRTVSNTLNIWKPHV